jgi:hypothetical protein
MFANWTIGGEPPCLGGSGARRDEGGAALAIARCMAVRRVIGLVLVVIGLVALLWGGVFWTDRDTVVDAGPLEIETEEREGFAVPPALGVVVLIGGLALLLIPDRRRI